MKVMRSMLSMLCPTAGFSLSFSGGGMGNSGPSSTSSKTETNDMRIAGGNGSINTSSKYDVSGSSNNITFTDHGAVAGALAMAGDTVNQGMALALHGIDGANQIATQTVAANGNLLTGSLKMAADNQQQTLTTIKDLKSADVRVLAMVGIAVVGLAAATIFKHKGA